MNTEIVDGERLIAIGCLDVANFLATYYRRDRYDGRGEEYAAGLLASAQGDFERYGHVLISRHDCVLGRAVWYYGTAADAARALRADAAMRADRAAHFESIDARLQIDANLEREQARDLLRQAREMDRLAALGK